MKRAVMGLILGCWAQLILAQTVVLKDGHPDGYVVKPGDTLWSISSLFLKDPWLWPEIWHINPDISNPHLILPGDKLALIYVKEGPNGELSPKLTVVERGALRIDPNEHKIKPGMRTSLIESAIPAIPLEKISSFLTETRVVTMQDLDAAPYVVAADSRRIIAGVGDKIYGRGNFPEDENVYGVYRAGDVYVDPVSGETLGIQALGLGSARMIAQKGDVVTLILNESRGEIRINDKLLPSEQKKVTATFLPKAPKGEVRGTIINVEGGVTQVASLNVVAMNIGERDGLEVGDVLAIAQSGEVVKDPTKNELVQMPDERAGLMIVFRTFRKMAFGFVVSADRPLRVGDRVSNP